MRDRTPSRESQPVNKIIECHAPELVDAQSITMASTGSPRTKFTADNLTTAHQHAPRLPTTLYGYDDFTRPSLPPRAIVTFHIQVDPDEYGWRSITRQLCMTFTATTCVARIRCRMPASLGMVDLDMAGTTCLAGQTLTIELGQYLVTLR
jgi:hypothetical protein